MGSLGKSATVLVDVSSDDGGKSRNRHWSNVLTITNQMLIAVIIHANDLIGQYTHPILDMCKILRRRAVGEISLRYRPLNLSAIGVRS